MKTFSALLAVCAGNSLLISEFPSKRPVTRSFDVFFDLRLNKWLSKQSRRWWLEMPSCSLWRHCNDGLVQDCSISIANALDILQSRTKPSICWLLPYQMHHLLQNRFLPPHQHALFPLLKTPGSYTQSCHKNPHAQTAVVVYMCFLATDGLEYFHHCRVEFTKVTQMPWCEKLEIDSRLNIQMLEDQWAIDSSWTKHAKRHWLHDQYFEICLFSFCNVSVQHLIILWGLVLLSSTISVWLSCTGFC